MNFLAHAALAYDAAHCWSADADQTQGLLAGAVIGDYVKGRIPTDWPVALQAGVALHRRIDALSNRHSGVQTTCSNYPEDLRRYAPIFVDLLADHSLARKWHTYYEKIGKHAVSEACYIALNEHLDKLPPTGIRFANYMQDVDLLANYDEWSHIEQGFKSVLRRLKVSLDPSRVLGVCTDQISATDTLLTTLYPDLRAEFSEWNAFNAVQGSL